MVVGLIVGVTILSEIIKEDDKIAIDMVIFLTIGYSLILFSIGRIAILSIQAMALAEAGIVATRKRWLILVGKYGAQALFLIYCAVGVISLLASNFDIEFFFTSYFGISFVMAVFLGFLFGYLSYKFRALAANRIPTNTEQQSISNRCREIHRFTMIISICFFLIAIALALMVVMRIAGRFDVFIYLTWANSISFALVVYIFIRDLSLLASRNEHNFLHKVPIKTPLLEPTRSQTTPILPTLVHGITITNKDQDVLGMAPHAPKPSWLPTNGIGQANVEPNRWSISLENWVRFVHECMATATWSSLAEAKGEKNISMYDINVHFIKPWTSGTGCSIACLMEGNQGPVDLMISHAWAGSVIESLNSIKTITTMYLVPKETRIFFDTMCMYQADDGAIDGLSIPQQLNMKPFQNIIHNKPKRGMFIIHTTISEVYERLWCVHEVDEAIEAKIEIYGAFDPSSWNAKALKNIVTSFSTKSAECQGESDKEMLTNLVNARGVFDRLDSIVRDVRQQSIKDLKTVNLFEQLFSMSISSVDTFHDNIV